MGNSFTRPPRVLGGNRQAISAKDFNLLARGIEELQNAIQPQRQGNRQNIKIPPPLWTSISQVPDSDPAEYQATVTLGYLTYQNANAAEAEQGVTGYLVPKIRNTDGEWISMDEVAPVVIPAVPLPALASWVYLRVKTTADGMPDFEQEGGPVTIEAFDSEQKSIHHVRPSPNGEEAGDYYFLLLETESNGATPTPAPRAKRRITGNREMPNQLIEITNIQEDAEDGEVRELYKGYLPGPEDKHELRTVVQIQSRGVPVIKPRETGAEEGSSIKWRRVADRETSVQINVSEQADGDVIQIEGNGQTIDYTDPFGGGLMFEDGLVILKKEPEEGLVGANFNERLLNVKITEAGGEIFITDIGWGTAERFIYIRNGLSYLVDDGANVPVYDVISRIEGESNPESNQSGDGLTPAA